MKLVRLIVLFLMVSFVVQNTCPYGLAAKTGFTAKKMHHCPMKKYSETDDTAQKPVFQTGQTFVVTIGSAINAIIFSLPEPSFIVSKVDFYKNIFSEPPVKPPRFIIL